MAIDIKPLQAWIGRQETASETLAPFPAAALTASLDREDPPALGDALPPLWHWVYFHELPKASELAENGHARLGEFMPPVPLPRRMIAGGRLTFQRPLRVGQPAQRISTVADLKAKHGASGDLAFLLLRHEFAGPDGAAIVEEQDLVYREAQRPGQAAAVPRRIADKPVWKWETPTGEALLFRYSALLFNAHRIHYDRPYCEAQGYPGLIVHGPLIATLLADLVRRNTDAVMTEFRFRAMSPLFNGSPCVACGVPEGNHVKLWAQDENGALIMEGQAEFATNT